jgi:hypothetical protein
LRARFCWLHALILYAALATLLTWPLLLRLDTHLPLGHLTAATVPYLNLWTLEWNADRLLHGLSGYFDAPIFYPLAATSTFSEPQGATGLVFAPLSWLLGSVAAYNLVLLLALAANGLAMRRCVQVAGGDELAATCCGALTVGLPFVLEELGVLQLTMLAPPLLMFAELIGMHRTPSGARLARAAAWFALTLWSCEYYALFSTLLAVPTAVALLFDARVRRVITPRAVLLALLLAVVPAAPLVLTQHAALTGQSRSAQSIRRGSASALSYVRLPAGSLEARVLPALVAPDGRRSLWPGAVLLVLAAFGRRVGLRGERRALAKAVALGCALSLLISFGTRLVPGDAQPYAWTVQRFVPGFAQLRSPYRMAAFAQLALVMLAAFSLDALREARWSWRARPLALALAGALVGLALLETVPFGQALQRFPDEALHEPWIDWLSRQPRGAVAMLPPSRSGEVNDLEPIALAMLQGLRHGQPLVDGYSGYFPPHHRRTSRRSRAFPEPQAIAALCGAQARYLVANDAWVAERTAETQRAVDLPTLFSAEGRTVYALPASCLHR